MGLKNRVAVWVARRELNNQAKEGSMIGAVWTWFDGKKTLVGGVIAVISYIAAGVPLLSPLCNGSEACVAHIATAGGAALALVGILHKAYKFIYKSDI